MHWIVTPLRAEDVSEYANLWITPKILTLTGRVVDFDHHSYAPPVQTERLQFDWMTMPLHYDVVLSMETSKIESVFRRG